MLIEDLNGQFKWMDCSVAAMATFHEICRGINDGSLEISRELEADIRELADDRLRLYTFRLASRHEREEMKMPYVIMNSSPELLAILARVSRELEPRARQERPEPRYFVR